MLVMRCHVDHEVMGPARQEDAGSEPARDNRSTSTIAASSPPSNPLRLCRMSSSCESRGVRTTRHTPSSKTTVSLHRPCLMGVCMYSCCRAAHRCCDPASSTTTIIPTISLPGGFRFPSYSRRKRLCRCLSGEHVGGGCTGRTALAFLLGRGAFEAFKICQGTYQRHS